MTRRNQTQITSMEFTCAKEDLKQEYEHGKQTELTIDMFYWQGN